MASSRQTPSFLLLVTSAQATLTPEIERHITEYLLAELSLIDGAEDDERRSALYYRVRSKSAARDVLSTASLFRGDDGVENSSNGSVEDALPSKCASTFSLTVERQRRRSTVEEYFDRILLSAPEPQTYSYPSYSDEPCAESDSCLEESYVEDSYVEPKQALYQHAVNPDDDFVKIKAAHLSASSHVDSVRPSHYKLSKEDLQGMVAVGQSACRFVLGVTRLGSLVCADQHAADERIRLEEYTETIRLSFQRIDAVVSLSNLESIALQESAQAVQVWGFRWTVEGARVGATAGDVSCVLVQVPVVLGVALTPSDFVEFVKFVASNRQLPSSLKKPPSIHRIVACSSLLHKLSLTDLPFQCAHGRPSLQTIADMSAVHAKRRESTEHHGRYSALHQHTS
jgi:DNA mismatch repair ATPase MutL